MPWRIRKQEIVPLSYDQRYAGSDGNCASDRFLHLAFELGRIYRFFCGIPQPSQQNDVTRSIECFGCALAVPSTPTNEFLIGQVKPVHWDVATTVAQRPQNRLRQR